MKCVNLKSLFGVLGIIVLQGASFNASADPSISLRCSPTKYNEPTASMDLELSGVKISRDSYPVTAKISQLRLFMADGLEMTPYQKAFELKGKGIDFNEISDAMGSLKSSKAVDSRVYELVYDGKNIGSNSAPISYSVSFGPEDDTEHYASFHADCVEK